ncbi:MAG: phospho-N-acetylmuramoyl-pentapeptide-transferase [Rhodobiaceae bacterium]|nr:phospho-N-acetylmuramoyl-pentapeptide-transferase [Rhodobiaceae bacterium]|tara:strand:- start:70285 stop:71370 length:1086 start_codon:yes stop_codon:yes gene_type:complete
MLILLINELLAVFPLLNAFAYITTRTVAATFTSGIIVFFLSPTIIRYLKKHQKNGQPIRQDGPKRHIIEKSGTPTMGGFIILLGVLISSILWVDLNNKYIWIVGFVTISFGLIGFYDDFLKVTKSSPNGMKSLLKFILQAGIAIIAILYLLIFTDDFQPVVYVPFLKDFSINLGIFFLVFGALVIIGSSNSVNLTDGLDGLAIMPVMIAVGSFGLIAYLTGNILFAEYLNIQYMSGSGELAIICGAVIGAGLGFLWYNAPPAMIFMGDTGSLSLGSIIGIIAIITKHELVLMIIGGLFVLEAISVIVQVISYRYTGKRIFKMAPLHHHFEQKGWSEATIVIRFWIISLILAMIGLLTLKLR